MTALHLHTPRGGQVAARVFEPPVDVQSTLQVVIGPAMGVAQRYYADFAAWLAGRGMRVLTFDYRGQADSLALLPGRRVRHVDATLHDWRADYEAVTLHLHALAPGLPLRLIGHSLGAQLPGCLIAPTISPACWRWRRAAATGARTRRSCARVRC